MDKEKDGHEILLKSNLTKYKFPLNAVNSSSMEWFFFLGKLQAGCQKQTHRIRRFGDLRRKTWSG